MENNPFFSVIIPAYNSEKTICKMIDSICTQSFADFELLIVNDGSTDNTKNIVLDYMKTEKRIFLLNQENSGTGKAKNNAIALAKGKYLLFFDSDDWVEKDLFQNMYDICSQKAYDALVFGYFQDVVDEKEYLISSNQVWMENQEYTTVQGIIANVPVIDAKKLFAYTWNKLYKTDIVKKHHIQFTEKQFGEDYDFNIEYIRYVKTMKVFSEAYYHYVKRNNDSLTEKYIPKFYEIILDRYMKMKKLLSDNDAFTGVSRELAATVHIKHLLSFFVRNHKKVPKMKLAEHYGITKEIISQSINIEACECARASSLQGNLCNAVFKMRNSYIIVGFTFMVALVKYRLNKVFEVMK